MSKVIVYNNTEQTVLARVNGNVVNIGDLCISPISIRSGDVTIEPNTELVITGSAELLVSGQYESICINSLIISVGGEFKFSLSSVFNCLHSVTVNKYMCVEDGILELFSDIMFDGSVNVQPNSALIIDNEVPIFTGNVSVRNGMVKVLGQILTSTIDCVNSYITIYPIGELNGDILSVNGIVDIAGTVNANTLIETGSLIVEPRSVCNGTISINSDGAVWIHEDAVINSNLHSNGGSIELHLNTNPSTIECSGILELGTMNGSVNMHIGNSKVFVRSIASSNNINLTVGDNCLIGIDGQIITDLPLTFNSEVYISDNSSLQIHGQYTNGQSIIANGPLHLLNKSKLTLPFKFVGDTINSNIHKFTLINSQMNVTEDTLLDTNAVICMIDSKTTTKIFNGMKDSKLYQINSIIDMSKNNLGSTGTNIIIADNKRTNIMSNKQVILNNVVMYPTDRYYTKYT